MIYPFDVANSPLGGAWRQVSEKRFLAGSDLKQQIESTPPLLKD